MMRMNSNRGHNMDLMYETVFNRNHANSFSIRIKLIRFSVTLLMSGNVVLSLFLLPNPNAPDNDNSNNGRFTLLLMGGCLIGDEFGVSMLFSAGT